MSVFKNQAVTLILDTKIDLTDATELTIKYRKPSGTTGEFHANIDSLNTRMRYQCENEDLDVAGSWQLQAYAVIDGLNHFGDKVSFTVH